MNFYKKSAFVQEYDQFYRTNGGWAVDKVEKAVISNLLKIFNACKER
ncbi:MULTISPECIES: hypothetical protein [Proteiniphilum]|jgi:hypothetical protein|nr:MULTISPECIES: hypothetical protein [Proteiniphilum]MDD2328835.1 hypothetical protein [bacterium]MDD4460307.1 hypothetical protein [Proteiniphilum sp.]ULB35900.1 hypothetical protein KDN43_07780 [Proteiniphilum propionicum]